jgi:hypothetical protein
MVVDTRTPDWYRSGMQDWENLWLTTVKPESE